jgi:hypothetical protein
MARVQKSAKTSVHRSRAVTLAEMRRRFEVIRAITAITATVLRFQNVDLDQEAANALQQCAAELDQLDAIMASLDRGQESTVLPAINADRRPWGVDPRHRRHARGSSR